MRISEIEYTGVKGVTARLEPAHCNLFTGPNGSGKTARLLGPSIAVLGGTPLGDTPQATMLLAGHDGCAVRVKLDDGFEWTRAFEKNRKSKAVSEKLSVNGNGGALREAKEELAEKVGCFAPMFDLQRFLALSPEKRREFILTLCGHGQESASFREKLIDEYLEITLGTESVELFAEAKFGGTDLDAEQQEQLRNALLGRMDKSEWELLQPEIAEVCRDLSEDATEAVREAMERLKDRISFLKKRRTEAESASRSLAQKKADLPSSASSLEELKSQRDELSSQKEKISEQIANQKGRDRAVKSMTEEIQRTENELAAAKGRLESLAENDVPDLSEAEALEKQAEELELQLQAD